MLRFSLLTLLGVVLVAAVGSAALANPADTGVGSASRPLRRLIPPFGGAILLGTAYPFAGHF
jgi:hypothetical protein